MGMETFLITNFVPKKGSGLLIFWKYRWKNDFKVVIWDWAAQLAPILKPVSIGGSDLMSQKDVGVSLAGWNRFERHSNKSFTCTCSRG